jgi:hypothetical protein
VHTLRKDRRVPSSLRGLSFLVPLALGVPLLVGAAPAVPAAPADAGAVLPAVGAQTLTDEVTDLAGVLSADEITSIRAAQDELAQDTRLQLYVVYVDSFSSTSPETWSTSTRSQSGLGSDDLLLAVATEDRLYYLSPSSTTDLTSAELDDLAADVEDDLRGSDWAAAAVTAADGARALATGTTSSGSGSSGSGGSGSSALGWVFIGGLVLIAVFAAIGWANARRRTQQRVGAGAGVPGGAPVPGGPAGDLAALPTAELDRRSASALVGIDDALRSSEQELGFAQAQFGPDATREFEQVLARSKEQVTEAFRLRQTLDDDIPDTEPQIRATATRILHTVAGVSAALDAQKEAFDRLRDVESRAAEAIEAHARTAAAQRARVEAARSTLASLAATYPASALASVQANPDQADALLTEVGSALDQGRAASAGGDRALAVRYARAAEEALGQVGTLLDAVDRAGADLATIGSRLDTAIASISTDIADADRLAPQHPEISARAQDARTAVEAGRTARAGTGDPLAALRALTAAEAALDAALAPLREQQDRARRALGLLDQTLGRVDSAVRGTTDYIETRRGAVGPEARTRLAEAGRLLRAAIDQRSADPEQALATAQQAERLVHEAQQLAQRDVDYSDQQRRGGGGGDGGIGSLGGMVLGGILIDSILRGGGGFGGGHRGGGGGWGGGGHGGGFGGGGGGRGGGFGGGGGGGGRGGGF